MSFLEESAWECLKEAEDSQLLLSLCDERVGPRRESGLRARGRPPLLSVLRSVTWGRTRAPAAGDGWAAVACPQRAGHCAGVQTSSTEVSPFCLEASRSSPVPQSPRAHPSLRRCPGLPRPAVQPRPRPGRPRGCKLCAARRSCCSAGSLCAAPRCARLGARPAGGRTEGEAGQGADSPAARGAAGEQTGTRTRGLGPILRDEEVREHLKQESHKGWTSPASEE